MTISTYYEFATISWISSNATFSPLTNLKCFYLQNKEKKFFCCLEVSNCYVYFSTHKRGHSIKIILFFSLPSVSL